MSESEREFDLELVVEPRRRYANGFSGHVRFQFTLGSEAFDLEDKLIPAMAYLNGQPDGHCLGHALCAATNQEAYLSRPRKENGYPEHGKDAVGARPCLCLCRLRSGIAERGSRVEDRGTPSRPARARPPGRDPRADYTDPKFTSTSG